MSVYVNVHTSINKQVMCINQSILLGFSTEFFLMLKKERREGWRAHSHKLTPLNLFFHY